MKLNCAKVSSKKVFCLCMQRFCAVKKSKKFEGVCIDAYMTQQHHHLHTQLHSQRWQLILNFISFQVIEQHHIQNNDRMFHFRLYILIFFIFGFREEIKSFQNKNTKIKI